MAMDANFSGEILKAFATPVPEDPQAVLHSAYGAIAQGNYDVLLEVLAPDVEFSIRGFGEMDGTWQGCRAVTEATRTNFGKVADQKPVIAGILSQGSSVAVLFHETGVWATTGTPYHVQGVQWFTFEGGKIRKITQIIAPV